MNKKYIQEQEELIANVKGIMERLGFDSNEKSQEDDIISLKERIEFKNKATFYLFYGFLYDLTMFICFLSLLQCFFHIVIVK